MKKIIFALSLITSLTSLAEDITFELRCKTNNGMHLGSVYLRPHFVGETVDPNKIPMQFRNEFISGLEEGKRIEDARVEIPPNLVGLTLQMPDAETELRMTDEYLTVANSEARCLEGEPSFEYKNLRSLQSVIIDEQNSTYASYFKNINGSYHCIIGPVMVSFHSIIPMEGENAIRWNSVVKDVTKVKFEINGLQRAKYEGSCDAIFLSERLE